MTKDLNINISVPERVLEAACRLIERQIENTCGMPRDTDPFTAAMRKIQDDLIFALARDDLSDLASDPDLDIERRARRQAEVIFAAADRTKQTH